MNHSLEQTAQVPVIECHPRDNTRVRVLADVITLTATR